MRLKLIAGNVVVVLLVGLAAYLVVRNSLRDALAADLQESIESDSELLSRSWRLAGTELAADVADRASSTAVQKAFSGGDEGRRRRRAFDAAQDVSTWFQDPVRGRRERPKIVALIDETGRVVARDTDPNRMFGTSLRKEVEQLRTALDKGVPAWGIWEEDGRLAAVAVAPVRDELGAILGALLVGYDLSNGFAQREAQVIGDDVAFITREKVYSASTSAPVRNALQGQLFSESLDAATRGALAGKRSAPWRADLDGDRYVGVTAPLPNSGDVEAGYVVLVNETQQVAPAQDAARMILWLTLLGLLGVVIYGFIMANAIMDPIARIEDDILAVINGRNDVRLEIDTPELGGLSYRVNQLINMFTGVAEEDEEGRAVTSSGGWAAVTATGPEIVRLKQERQDSQDKANDVDAEALAGEPEASYYARLYKEYVEAKRGIGEDVSNIPEERFVERIKNNAAHLLNKHSARMVRFRVETEGGQVNLKPVVID